MTDWTVVTSGTLGAGWAADLGDWTGATTPFPPPPALPPGATELDYFLGLPNPDGILDHFQDGSYPGGAGDYYESGRYLSGGTEHTFDGGTVTPTAGMHLIVVWYGPTAPYTTPEALVLSTDNPGGVLDLGYWSDWQDPYSTVLPVTPEGYIRPELLSAGAAPSSGTAQAGVDAALVDLRTRTGSASNFNLISDNVATMFGMAWQRDSPTFQQMAVQSHPVGANLNGTAALTEEPPLPASFPADMGLPPTGTTDLVGRLIQLETPGSTFTSWGDVTLEGRVAQIQSWDNAGSSATPPSTLDLSIGYRALMTLGSDTGYADPGDGIEFYALPSDVDLVWGRDGFTDLTDVPQPATLTGPHAPWAAAGISPSTLELAAPADVDIPLSDVDYPDVTLAAFGTYAVDTNPTIANLVSGESAWWSAGMWAADPDTGAGLFWSGMVAPMHVETPRWRYWVAPSGFAGWGIPA